MASGLSTGDIAGMRSTLEDTALPGTAVILERQRTPDGMGGQTNTYAATGTVEARLDYKRASQDERAEKGETASIQPYILTTPRTATIVDTGRVTYDSVTYEVRSVLPQEPWDLCQRAEVVRFD